MPGCNAVFMTAAANPWVIRLCEISKFQMQKMQYLEEYFSLLLDAKSVFCGFEPIEWDTGGVG